VYEDDDNDYDNNNDDDNDSNDDDNDDDVSYVVYGMVSCSFDNLFIV